MDWISYIKDVPEQAITNRNNILKGMKLEKGK